VAFIIINALAQINASNLLPQTEVWKEWKTEALKDDGRDVSDIYKEIANRWAAFNQVPNAAPATP
jgi:hypothetical protein